MVERGSEEKNRPEKVSGDGERQSRVAAWLKGRRRRLSMQKAGRQASASAAIAINSQASEKAHGVRRRKDCDEAETSKQQLSCAGLTALVSREELVLDVLHLEAAKRMRKGRRM